MEKSEIEGIIYKNIYSFKYMLEQPNNFGAFAGTVAAMVSREIEYESKSEEDES
jgi:hypothetical protein